MSSLFGDLDIAKIMFGQNAFHIPFNMIVQQVGDGDKAAGIFQTESGKPLYFGSVKSHVMILADVVVRPQLVLATDEMAGHGIGGIYSSGFHDMMGLLQQDKCDVLLVSEALKHTLPKRR